MITIEKLREQKEKMGVSYQWIADKTEDIGCAVSITTIKRVFSQGADESVFKRSSLDAIAQALDVYEEDDTEIESLKKLLYEKDQMISKLEKQIEDTADYTEGRLDYLKEADKNKYDFIVRQEKKLAHKDRIILSLSIVIALCLITDIIALGYDVINPNVGYLRSDVLSPLLTIFICVIVAGVTSLVHFVISWVKTRKEDKHDL